MAIAFADIVIKKKFREENRALKEEELEQLEANILADKQIIDPLVVWVKDGENILIDGFHRHGIARKHDELQSTVKVREMKFGDENEVLLWICEHATGRRNFNDTEYSYNRGKIYQYKKLREGKPDEEDAKGCSTRVEVAEQFGVSEATVGRDAAIAVALDKLPTAVRDAYLTKDLPMNKSEVLKLASMPASNVTELHRDVRVGNYPDVATALDKKYKKFVPAKPKKAKGKAESKAESNGKKADAKEAKPLTAGEKMAEWNAKVEAVIVALNDVKKLIPDGPWMDQRAEILASNIKTAVGTARLAKCEYQCPKCKGDCAECTKCRKTGIVPKTVYEASA